MDSLFGLAKQGFQTYQQQQHQQQQQQQQPQQGNNQEGGQAHQTGGAQFNSPDHGDGGRPAIPDLDHNHVLQAADNHSGGPSGNSELFKQGLSFVQSQLSSGQAHHVDSDAELQKAQDAHKLASNGEPLSSSDIGSAAVFRAFQSFSGSASSGGGPNSQSKIIGLAMSEASKLFDQSGGASDGGKKQDVINSAASTVTKLLLKHQISSAIGGGNSGGLGGLLSLAGKFT